MKIRFEHADFRALANIFPEQFDIVIAMDNALPHMLTREELASLLMANGCSNVEWLFPDETAFYQPIVVAKK